MAGFDDFPLASQQGSSSSQRRKTSSGGGFDDFPLAGDSGGSTGSQQPTSQPAAPSPLDLLEPVPDPARTQTDIELGLPATKVPEGPSDRTQTFDSGGGGGDQLSRQERLSQNRAGTRGPSDPNEGRGLFNNAVRGAGERITDVGGSALEALSSATGAFDQFMTDLTGVRPGITADGEFTMNLEGPDLITENLQTSGQAVEDVDLGFNPRQQTSFDKVKDDPSAPNIAKFITEQGIQSLPEMAAVLNPVGLSTVIAGRSEESAEARARNNLPEGERRGAEPDVSFGDIAKTAPAETGAALLERFGAKGVFNKLPGAKSATGRTVGAASREAATEAAQEPIQLLNRRLGTERGVTPGDVANAAGAGALAGGGLGGALRGSAETATKVGNLVGRLRGKGVEQVTEQDIEEVADSPDPQAVIDEVRRGGDEELADVIAQRTGLDRAPQQPQTSREQAQQTQTRNQDRKARSDAFKFEQQVTPRDAIDPETGDVDSNAEPARDGPTGTQQSPADLAATREARQVAEANGVSLREQDIPKVAEELAALEQQRQALDRRIQSTTDSKRLAKLRQQRRELESPDDIVRSFSPEGAQTAFDTAQARRDRREQNLNENDGRERSDNRAAPNAREEQPQREVALLDPQRNRKGQLQGGEQVEVLARGQRTGPNGEPVDAVRIARTNPDTGETERGWVPAERVETVQTPDNPRMAQQAEADSRTPPRGVGETRGDPPRQNAGTSQQPEPRRSVDQQADPDGLRRGEFIPGGPDPDQPTGGPDPDQGATVEGRVPSTERRRGQGGEPTVSGERRQSGEPETPGQTSVERTRRPARDVDGRRDPNADPRQGVSEQNTGATDTGDQTVQQRLADPETRRAVQELNQSIGYQQRGGRLLRDEDGNVTGRTEWIPNDPNVQPIVQGTPYASDRGKLRNVIDKAAKGERLGSTQQRVVEELLDEAEIRTGKRADPDAEFELEPDTRASEPDTDTTDSDNAAARAFDEPGSTPRSEDDLDAVFGSDTRAPANEEVNDFGLEQPTEDSLAADEQAQTDRQQREQTAARQAEQREQAEREVDNFELTGSDRPADANPRQEDLVTQSRNQQRQQPSPSRGDQTTDDTAGDFPNDPRADFPAKYTRAGNQKSRKQDSRDAARAMGVPVGRTINDARKAAQAARAAASRIDNSPERETVSTLKQMAGDLGLPKSGTKPELLQRLRDWRAANPDSEIRAAAQVAEDVRTGELSVADAFDSGLMLRFPQVFPRSKQLLADTGNTGVPDWQKTPTEWARANIEENGREPTPEAVEDSAEVQRTATGSQEPTHRRRVRQAVQAGLNVPDAVLDAYPDSDFSQAQPAGASRAEANERVEASQRKKQADQQAERDRLNEQAVRDLQQAADSAEANGRPDEAAVFRAAVSPNVKSRTDNAPEGKKKEVNQAWAKARTGKDGGLDPFSPTLAKEGEQRKQERRQTDNPDINDTARESQTEAPSAANRKAGPNATFYSGFDPTLLAEPLSRVFGSRQAWADSFGQTREWVKHYLDRSTGGRGDSTHQNPFMLGIRAVIKDADDRLRGIAKRADIPGARRIADAFWVRAGDAQGTGREPFNTRLNRRLNRRVNRIAEIEEKFTEAFGRKSENREKAFRQLRKLIENPEAPRRGKIGQIADDVEQFLREDLRYQRGADIDIGEIVGYFPRILDRQTITAGGGPRSQNGQAKAIEAFKKALQIDNPGMSDADARHRATLRWQHEVYGTRTGNPGMQMEASQPGKSDQTKERTLSKKAIEESGMIDLMNNDVFEVMNQYTRNATLRGELANTEIELSDGSTQKIGPNWQNWQTIREDMEAESGTERVAEHIDEIENMVATVSGVKARSLGTGNLATAMSYLRTATVLRFLDQALFTSLPEPFIAGVRQIRGGTANGVLKDHAAILGNMGKASRDAVGAIMALPRREQNQGARDLLIGVGEVAENNKHATNADRFAGGDPGGKAQSAIITGFFRGIGLEQFTNYGTVLAAENAMTFMRSLVKDLDAGGKRARNARFHLKDLNIPESELDTFTQFVRGLKGKNPDFETLLNGGRGAQLYTMGMTKFTQETIMRPNSATEPAYAAHPLGKAIFQLQSFPFSFTKQVLFRPFRVAKNSSQDVGTINSMLSFLPFITGMGAISMTQGIVGELRDAWGAMLSGEEEDDMSVAAIGERAMSRAGLFGKFDPYIQTISGTRYQKSPLESLLGPGIGGASQTLTDIAGLAVGNSEKTNTAERNFYKSVFDMIVTPGAQVALNAVPTGAGNAVARTAIQPLGKDRAGNAIFPDSRGREDSGKRFSLAEHMLGLTDDEGSGGHRSGSRGGGRDGSRSGTR